MRILVTSTIRDAINTNVAVRRYVYEGLAEVLGASCIRVCHLEVATSGIDEFQPDLVLAVGSLASDDSDLRKLRRVADRQGAAVAFWLHDDPYEFDYAYKAIARADIVFTNDAWAAHHYRHPNVHHLPLAASALEHLRPILPPNRRDTGLFFCGVAFPNRVDLLRAAQPLISGFPVSVMGAGWPADLRFAVNQRLTAREMADQAQRASLTLNIGRDHDIANQRYGLPASTPGPRTFEVALAGSAQAFFVAGLEICNFFEPQTEILLFDSVVELRQLVERAQDEPQWSVSIAERAQTRALRDHTYVSRARCLLDHCRPLSVG